MYISECVHFLFILNYRCIIERTVTSLLFHVPTFTLCLLVVRSTSPCRQDHERTNVCVCVSVLNPLKKNGLSVRNIGKLQVAFLFAVLLFMSIHLWLWFCEGLHGFATKNQQTQTKRGYITLLRTGDHL